MPDWSIVAARLIQFGAASVLFGLPLFQLYAGGKHDDGTVLPRWGWAHRSVLVAATGALIGAIWWIVAQTAAIFPGGPFDPNSIWIVATGTGFGRVASLRVALIALAVAVLVISPRGAAWVLLSLLGAAILSTFAWTGHGIFDSGWTGAVHTGADVLHLLAAGAWVGALASLSILLLSSLRPRTEADARVILDTLERFSGIGPGIVAILVFTGLINSWFLVGIARWPALFTTAYGMALTVKLGLFGAMLFLAAANRYRFSPKLGTDIERRRSPVASLQKLRISILTETSLAILVLAAVAMLGTLEPPISGS